MKKLVVVLRPRYDGSLSCKPGPLQRYGADIQWNILRKLYWFRHLACHWCHGNAIAAIVPVGVDPNFVYNNLYYYPANPTHVDYCGIVFDVAGIGDVNLCYYSTDGGCGSGGYTAITWDSTNGYGFTGITSSNLGQPTPEPGRLALVATGAVALAGALRRKLMW